jgi:hypothetical protein
MAVSAKSGSAIIGCEVEFVNQKRIFKEERAKLIRRRKEYVKVSYDNEARIAARIGADEGALNGWLAGKVKPTFQSLLKVRDFLESQAETGGGIAPIGYVPIRGNNPDGRRGKGGENVIRGRPAGVRELCRTGW